MPHLKSVRRDAERGGRDDRAPKTPAFRAFNSKGIIDEDVAGEGAGHDMRGRIRSPESFAVASSEDWAQRQESGGAGEKQIPVISIEGAPRFVPGREG